MSASTNTYRAQFGEDRLLEDYFGGRSEGVCLEVGAYNGEDMSNTYHFEKHGWQCLLVEPHPQLAAECRQRRPRSTVFECAAVAPGHPPTGSFQVVVGLEDHSGVALDAQRLARVEALAPDARIEHAQVRLRTLDSILEECRVQRLDFVSVDTEGHELETLRGLDLRRWKPTLLLIERSGSGVAPRLARLLAREGYRYLRCSGVNDWFERGPRSAWRVLFSLGHYEVIRCARTARDVVSWGRAWLVSLRARLQRDGSTRGPRTRR